MDGLSLTVSHTYSSSPVKFRREAEEKDQGKNKNRTDGHRVKERFRIE